MCRCDEVCFSYWSICSRDVIISVAQRKAITGATRACSKKRLVCLCNATAPTLLLPQTLAFISAPSANAVDDVARIKVMIIRRGMSSGCEHAAIIFVAATCT